jgi:glutamyl/glutaminyl-tRNA synthetase
MLTISDVLAKRDIGEREARRWQYQTNYLPTLRSLRREDFQALAQRYFVDSLLIRVHILPGAKANEGDEK